MRSNFTSPFYSLVVGSGVLMREDRGQGLGNAITDAAEIKDRVGKMQAHMPEEPGKTV